MQYYVCKCGKTQHWSSGMPPFPCTGCPECNTTAMKNPDGTHIKPVPHEFVVGTVETDEGAKPLSRCKWCYKTKARIEKEEKPRNVLDLKG